MILISLPRALEIGVEMPENLRRYKFQLAFPHWSVKQRQIIIHSESIPV